MFYLAGVSLAFFLSSLLLTKSKKTLADKILMWWLLLITVHLLLFYFYKMRLYPDLLGVRIPFPLVHGPFLFLYTQALTNKMPPLRMSLLHFIPFFAVFIYLIDFLLLPAEQKIRVYENNGAGYEVFNQVVLIAIICSGVVYVTASFIALRKHRASIADQFSNTEKISLIWLQNLIYWIGVIWILVIIGNDDLIYGATVVFIAFIGFFGIRQVGIFYSPEHPSSETSKTILASAATAEEPFSETTPDEQPQQERKKYQKSGLNQDLSESLHRQLKALMANEKTFQDADLSLSELARILNTQPNYLSQVLNEREQKNFYDYINTLRIEEFKRLVASGQGRRYTLLALAQQCGFNSKSSFNRYFKKVTRQSPSEFMAAVSDSDK